MSGVQTDLVGAIVAVSRVEPSLEGGARERSRILLVRGVVRAVTTVSSLQKERSIGNLRLWVEELNEAEVACWFGDPPTHLYNNRQERPGRLFPVSVIPSEGVQIDVVKQVASGK